MAQYSDLKTVPIPADQRSPSKSCAGNGGLWSLIVCSLGGPWFGKHFKFCNYLKEKETMSSDLYALIHLHNNVLTKFKFPNLIEVNKMLKVV